MTMGRTTVIQAGGIEVVCREMTVGELRAAITAEYAPDVVDAFLFADARLSDIQAMTNLDAEKMSSMRPSDLRAVLDACKKANPDFFEMAARLSQPAAK